MPALIAPFTRRSRLAVPSFLRAVALLFALASAARAIEPQFVFSTLAGSAGLNGSADGAGAEARFGDPFHIAVDTAGNLYVADRLNHTVRKISPQGVVSTLAGLAGQSGSVDGAGSAARFNSPRGIAVGGDGTVYVADTGTVPFAKSLPPEW